MDRLHKHIATLLHGLVEEAQGRKFPLRNAVVQPAAEPEPEAEANSDSCMAQRLPEQARK